MSALKVPITPLETPHQHTNHTPAPLLPSSRLNTLDRSFVPAALEQTMGALLSRPQKPLPPRLNAASTCM